MVDHNVCYHANACDGPSHFVSGHVYSVDVSIVHSRLMGSAIHIPRIVTSPPAAIHGLSLLHNFSIATSASVHEEQQKAGEEEKDGIHDPKREARFEHGASLVNAAREGAAVAVESIRSQ